MLFSYAVHAIYVESGSMFVRGGVYRVVKEALGGTLAKFSVSSLMFNFVPTGPISGVSAGQYLVGVTNEMLAFACTPIHLSVNATATVVAIAITLYFWSAKRQGRPGIERESTAHYAAHHDHGGDANWLVPLYVRGAGWQAPSTCSCAIQQEAR
jgi:hypothetical protein